MTTSSLAVIGGGNMGAALAGGLLASNWITADRLAVVEVLEAGRERLREQFPGVTITDTTPPCEAAVIAVKPPDAPAAAAAAAAAGARRIVSVAAGVSIATLEAAAGPGVVVIRTIPNTPALVGLGACGMSAGTSATAEDVAWATGVLRAVGTVEVVPEYQLDAVTGLTGSGPAYLFMVAEALIDAGVLAGLSRSTAEALVTQLFLGSAEMLSRNGNPAGLRAQVTSPGGTTAAGLKVLEDHALRAAFQSAVLAASERSRELGRAAH
jgi:pyrroline-5-carboxylate reductase